MPSIFSMPTNGRAENLSLCLPQWLELFQKHPEIAPDRILISDDIPNSPVETLVRDIQKDSNIPVQYLGTEKKQWLSQKLPDRQRSMFDFSIGQVAEFTSLGLSYGGNPNMILLGTGSSQYLTMCDDDMYPRFGRITPALQERGYRYAMGADWNELKELSIEVTSDIYAQTFGNFRSDSWADIYHHPYWGHSGADAPRFIYSGREAYYCDIETEDRYNAVIQANLIVRNPDTTTQSTVMTGHIFMKNLESILPFSPRGRNIDGLWGAMHRAIGPIPHTSYAVLHKPGAGRTVSREHLIESLPGINEVLMMLSGIILNGQGKSHWNAPALSQTLARGLKQLSANRQILAEALRKTLNQAFTARMAAIDRNLAAFAGEPFHWADDALSMYEFLEERKDALISITPFEILDIDAELMDRYIHYFAELLQNWPGLKNSVSEVGEIFGI